jgi:hypothetical protein
MESMRDRERRLRAVLIVRNDKSKRCAPKARRRKPMNGQGFSMRIGYNYGLVRRTSNAMEAEKLNQIAAALENLQTRTADLRRYL